MNLYFENSTRDLCFSKGLNYDSLVSAILNLKEKGSYTNSDLESLVPSDVQGLQILARILSLQFEDFEKSEFFCKKVLQIQANDPFSLTLLVYIVLNKQ